MKFKVLLTGFFAVLLFSTCRKTSSEFPSDVDCLTYPQLINSGIGGFKGYQVSNHLLAYFSPIFNPTNENEFIYVRQIRDSTNGQVDLTLLKYDLKTEKSTVIKNHFATNSLLTFTPDGRIAFFKNSTQIGIMDTDGGNEQLFFEHSLPVSEFLIHPQMHYVLMSYFDTAGTHIIRHALDGSYSDTSVWKMADLIFRMTDISKKDSVASLSFLNNQGVTLINLKTQWFQPIFLVGQGVGSTSFTAKWHPDNETVYFTDQNFGILKFRKGIQTLVKSNCDNKEYHGLSISSSGNKILTERTNRVKVGDTKLRVELRISIMNADGSEERLLDLK